ncbi:flagellar assembly protein FliW [Cellulomonas sp. URHE0023]|uniref:flagellar assembly protein FliW n=1 Tax=Cellulomonas sp. URHE0023 TaxID=1380354 RepID=UPI000689E532|nr:flagellar assembly protein FliW [Cellulomonas sp. URHE0023]
MSTISGSGTTVRVVAGPGPGDDVDVPALLELVAPLPGLPGHLRYALEPLDASGALFALRSIPTDEKDTPIRLFVVSPAVHFPDYSPTIDADELAWDAVTESTVALVVVHPGRTEQDSPTANLLAPIVVDIRTGAAAQVVLDGDWPVRAPVG